MKPPRQLFVLVAAVTLGACAALTPDRPRERDARHRLDRGLSALEAGAHPEAFDDLAWVYSHCPAREAGSRALVALAALELDPRNPRARPAVGTELLARVLQQPGAPRWARPLAETTFLTGLALGAPTPDGYDARVGGDPSTRTTDADREPASDADDAAPAAQPDPAPGAGADFGQPVADPTTAYNCGAVVAGEGWAPPPLPVLPGPSLAALLADTEAARDSLTAERNALQNELATVRAQLEATRAELERIRQTLKP